jgi:hypothetical protein
VSDSRTMRLLYPSDPLNERKPDETWASEFQAAKAAGLNCSVYVAEAMDAGEFAPSPAIDGDTVVYRGWMLSPANYARLQKAVECAGATMLVTTAQYRFCHHLPQWYPLCEDLTPRSIFLARQTDFATALAPLNWSAWFVKDYVKSLTTSRGSVAKTVEEVGEIVDLIEKYRGHIEGGVCVREFEDLLSETEERYFVFKGRAYSRDSIVPDIVESIARRIDSPFFSVDIVLSAQGQPRLIELGDGQVSDIKQWPIDTFVEIFRQPA